jgi:hypothetical protein
MRTSLPFILAAMLTATPMAAADTSLGPEEFTSVDELALSIASYFPKVQGPVTGVQGDSITIGLGAKDGIKPNMVLSVWRDGKEILHPVTKAVIGRAEDEVGTAGIMSVAESSSTAVLKRKVLEPQAGDRARISPRKISIAVLPLREDRPDIITSLGARLNELGRFEVLDQSKVAAFLKDRKQRDTSLVREMAGAFLLDAVVAVSILPSEGKYLTTTRIFSGDEAKPLDTIVSLISLSTKRDAFGDVRPFFAPVPATALKEAKAPDAKAESMPDLPLQARYFAVADLDGDGAREYVFSDAKKLVVLRLGPSGWQKVWTESVPARERDMQQFFLAAADINRNGRSEIFVTRMLDGRPSSYVIEFQDGSYRRIAEVPGFLRVLTVPGRGEVLIGQNFTPEAFFAGEVREYGWSGGTYSPGAPLPLPKDATLYNFVLGNLGDTRPLVAVQDDDHRLALSVGGTAIWRSEEKYYPGDTTVIRPLSGIDASVGRAPGELEIATGTGASDSVRERRVRIPGRIVAADIDGNGIEEIVVPKNKELAILGGSDAGTLEALGWTGTRLEPRWTVKDLSGPVLDIQVIRQEGRGASVYALVQKSGGLFSRDVSRLERYEVR